MTAEDEALLNFLQEPTFLLTPAGIVAKANAAARRCAGGDPQGRMLADFLTSERETFETWLSRCSGTASPLIGAVTFTDCDGVAKRYRTYGARLAGADPVLIAVRCTPSSTDAFSVLGAQVRALNAEVLQHQRTQAALRETLRGNEVLLRELHHRVKNNIQVMLGLFSSALREAPSEELKTFLENANRRLLAMGTAEQIMYQSQTIRSVEAKPFLSALCGAVGATLGPQVQIALACDDIEMANETAFPLALILNELVTNAFKHGLRGEGGAIGVTLERCGEEAVLTVRDDGPGFTSEATARRSSGLTLVRGLCRQIGGSLHVETDHGAVCRVSFAGTQGPLPNHQEAT